VGSFILQERGPMASNQSKPQDQLSSLMEWEPAPSSAPARSLHLGLLRAPSCTSEMRIAASIPERTREKYPSSVSCAAGQDVWVCVLMCVGRGHSGGAGSGPWAALCVHMGTCCQHSPGLPPRGSATWRDRPEPEASIPGRHPLHPTGSLWA